MTLERKIAGAFALDDETWLRHANPWSVALRNTVLPILVIAFWSRSGSDGMRLFRLLLPCSGPGSIPVFSPDRIARPLGIKGCDGRTGLAEPGHCSRAGTSPTAPNILSGVSGIGMLFVFWGVFAFDLWPTVFGMALVYCGKLWFLDRMAWLCEDMKDVSEYSKMIPGSDCVKK